MLKADCLKIQKEFGVKSIHLLKDLNLLNSNLKIRRETDWLLIPLTKKPNKENKTRILETISLAELSTSDFNIRKNKTQTIDKLLEKSIPSHLLVSLPKSFDIIGQVIITEIPPNLNEYERQIGESFLQVYPNTKTVLSKQSAISGLSRLRKYKAIAGTGETETIHKENGCLFSVDPLKAYFSPRLAYEHDRISKNVKDGEKIIDMFSGVGSFAIQIAKKHKNVKIYAIDLNPNAIQFLNKNVQMNKVSSKVIAIIGNAREIIEKYLTGIADRVIMNLPKKSIQFIDVACSGIKSSGGIIHYYEFANEDELFDIAKARLRTAIVKNQRQIEGTIAYRKVKEIAPYEWHIALDAFIR